MSQSKDQEYFADGLAEELLNRYRVPSCGSSAGLRRSSSRAGTKTCGRLPQARRGQSPGGQRPQGRQPRTTAQLIKAADGSHLWSETYERSLDDVFAVQDDIASAVATAMQVMPPKHMSAHRIARPAPRPTTSICWAASSSIAATWKTFAGRWPPTNTRSPSIRILPLPTPVWPCRKRAVARSRELAGGGAGRARKGAGGPDSAIGTIRRSRKPTQHAASCDSRSTGTGLARKPTCRVHSSWIRLVPDVHLLRLFSRQPRAPR